MCRFDQSMVDLDTGPNTLDADENMFIQDDFNIPDHLVTRQFRFEILEQSLTEIDYEAVMSSKQRLKHVFAEHDDWPADDMSSIYQCGWPALFNPA